MFAGIEAGGTKFNCAVGDGPGQLVAEISFPTTTPTETLGRAIAFFQEQAARGVSIQAMGVACFGPVDLRAGSPTYGFITSTPKPGWRNADVVGPLAAAFGVPVAFDTDVNGAALGEQRWGAAQGLDTFIYLTIGTGVGGGVMAGGRLLHGLVHPELGHIRIPHNWQADPFAGNCPFHGDCLEGMVAGPALARRWGRPGAELPPDHPAWPLQAHYIALGLASFIMTLSPQRIILGGGVMHQPQLLPMVRSQTLEALAGYVQAPEILDHIDSYIVSPGLGDRAGVLGAIALAMASGSGA